MKILDAIVRAYRKVDHWYKQGYNAVFFSCKHVSELSSQCLDRPLTMRERLTYWVHLRMCTWCRRYAQQMRFLRKQIGKYASTFPEESPKKLSKEAKSRILKKISDQSSDSL